MQLTPSQQKALDDSRHLVIVANAGSGKTSVLVTRYVDLLERHTSLTPRNLVAITYTEPAAAELKKRISDELQRRLIATTDNPARRRHLEALRDAMPGAYISTIHAFARRLLKTYPVEANIDPTFNALTGSEEDDLRLETISRVFKSTLDEAYAQNDENNLALRCFRRLGRTEITAVVEVMLKKRAISAKLHDYLDALTDDEVLASWEHAIRGFVEPVIQAQTERFDWIQGNIPDRIKTKQEIGDSISRLAAEVVFTRKCVNYLEAWNKLFTGKSKIRKTLIKENERDASLDVVESNAAEAHARIETVLEALANPEENHREYLETIRVIAELYDAVFQAYTETKNDHSLLDFDDMIVQLKRLVQHAEIAEELAAQFQFILIDEYQDTDHQQLEIASALTLNFGLKNKLAIVGDPKQSIYSFRNADIRVFNETKARIEQQTLSEEAKRRTLELGLNAEEARGSITLAESFRTADLPLAYINRLFARLMAQSESASRGEQNLYVPLVAARTGGVRGSIEWLIAPKPHGSAENFDDDDDSGDDTGSSGGEAELIARKILAIVNGAGERYFIHDRSKVSGDEIVARKPEFGDIAILLRNRKALLDEIEEACTRLRIRYHIHRGRGYFDQQEIVDLVAYLKFLLYSDDDVALLTMLRSPMFAMSDTLIYRIYASSTDKSSLRLWDRLQFAAEPLGESNPEVQSAVQLIQKHQALAGRTDASLILESIIHETGLIASYAAERNGEQAIANIEKLLAMARAHDARGLTTIYDFVATMKDRIAKSDDEPQAQTTTGDHVRIMTIHGAKGLEFPIVIAAGLAAKPNTKTEFSIDETSGIAFRSDRAPKPAIAALLRSETEVRMFEEETRLLYVALTRAQDHLILSAQSPFRKHSPAFKINELHNEALADESVDQLGLVEEIERYDPVSFTRRSELITASIPITRELPEVVSPQIEESGERSTPPFHLDSYVAGKTFERFSPSQLLTFQECPTKYYLRYVLGLPEDPRLVTDLEPPDLAEGVHGPLVGEIIHRMLEHVAEFGAADSVDSQLFEQTFDRVTGNLAIYDTQERARYLERAKKDVGRFLASDYAQIVLGAPVSKNEFSVHATLTKHDYLQGIIDRFFVTPEGEVHILDYKTDQRTGLQDPHKSKRYEFQVKFYAYLVSLLYPEKEKITATLFYTSNGAMQQYAFDRAGLKGIETTLRSMIADVRQIERAPSLNVIDRKLDHCRECAYFDGDAALCVATLAEKESLPLLQNPTEIPAR